MQLHTSRRGQLVVERLPDQRVREAQALASTWHWRKHARRHSLIEHVEQLVRLKLAQPRERIEPELAAEHGSEREHGHALVGQTPQPPSDHLAYTLRNAQRQERAEIDVGFQASLSGKQMHDLADEERIAFSLCVDRRDQLFWGLRPYADLDVARDVRGGQAADLDAMRHRLPRELCERRSQRIAYRRVDVAVRADDEYSTAAQLTRDESQQQQRGFVRGVQVVEDQHERTSGRRVLQEAGRGVEEPDAGSLGLD